ncbi:MAG: fumarylacetoacetate hydrolase family protein [Rhodospirillales bacterium]|nr:fumarylacetoacetate hydrolase family protein [Rhodospirillales bacterium]
MLPGMQPGALDAAVAALVTARRSRTRIAALPPGSNPASLAEAHAAQDATVAALGDRVAGWKVAITPQHEVMRGVILGSCLFPSPASIPAKDVPLLGIEGEIGFLFARPLPPRAAEYGPDDVAAASIAVVGIEIVASRFTDYAGTPLLDRTADCMSNGAYILGTRRHDWRGTDLSQLEATLCINGTIVVRKTAGHPTGDPIIPAVALANALRNSTGIATGQLITTGTYTGLNFASPGDRIAITFTGFGTAEVTITR